MRRFATMFAGLTVATLASAPALADCIPGTGLCASAGVAVGIPAVQVGGQVTLGIPPFVVPGFAPPPAAPPPPAYYPAPQQVYIYAPPQPRPMYVYAQPPQQSWGASRLGLDLRGDGATGIGADKLGRAYGAGGAGIGLRYRVAPHFGLEAGVDVLAGRDYNDHQSVEVIGTFGGLVYVNPRSRVQLYLSGGGLVDHAHTPGSAGTSPQVEADLYTPAASQVPSYTHVGGYGGLGLEMFATRRLAFHIDAKGFVRQHVGGDAPEFTDAAGHSTNTSGGVVGQVGMLFYF
jgi:hypothetical protein